MRNLTRAAVGFVFCLSLLSAGSDLGAGTSGAPLKGIDVKLGRNPGGAVIRTVKTDSEGKFDFGVLPRGSYYIVVGTEKAPGSAEARGAKGQQPADDLEITISIAGTTAGTLTYIHDRRSGSIIIMERGEASKARRVDVKTDKTAKMPFDSDGEHVVTGTIVKSKSNITNN